MNDTETEFDPARSAAIRTLLVATVTESHSRRHVRFSRKTMIVGSIVLASLATAGTAGAVSAANGWIALPNSIPGAAPSYGPIPHWPINAKGLTYGIQGDSPVPPDLIAAQGTNAQGQLVNGYVFSKDLDAANPTPTSAAQALQQQKQRLKDYPDGQKIPLYTSDGTTVIGTFLISTGQ